MEKQQPDVRTVPADALSIWGAPGLDPITVVTQDFALGRGRIIVECFGDAWSAYWGAIGTKTVRQFVASMGADYLADKLWPSTRRRTKREEQYLSQIAAAVVAALKTEASTS